MADECYSVPNGVNYIQRSSDVYLNCVDITNIKSRSVIECALLASGMEHYEDRFAYRNGKCRVCRADNENCVVLAEEYKLAGPHFVKGYYEPKSIICVKYLVMVIDILLYLFF